MAASTQPMNKSQRTKHFFKAFTNIAKGKASLENENLEEAAAFIEMYGKNAKSYSMMWKVILLVTIGVIALFLVKLGNTSEMALRYNQHAQTEMGNWMLVILGLAFMTVMFFFIGLMMRKRVGTWRSLLVSELRNRADRDADQKALYESLLRELGA